METKLADGESICHRSSDQGHAMTGTDLAARKPTPMLDNVAPEILDGQSRSKSPECDQSVPSVVELSRNLPRSEPGYLEPVTQIDVKACKDGSGNNPPAGTAEENELKTLTNPLPPPPRPVMGKSQPHYLPVIHSYEKLFRHVDDDDTFFIYDKYVFLQPFRTRCYVTNAVFTVQDVHKYAWILAQSEERWYAMPTVSQIDQMRTNGLGEIEPIEEPKPAKMDTPYIAAGEVLTLYDNFQESVDRGGWGDCDNLHPGIIGTPEDTLSQVSNEVEESDENASGTKMRTESPQNLEENIWEPSKLPEGRQVAEEDAIPATQSPPFIRRKWDCQLCADARSKLFDEIGWVYLSVIRTETQGVRSSQGNGMGMFMLKKHGSREGAAASAFCDAGARGWSTVFSCGIRADSRLLGWKGQWKTTNRIEDVLVAKKSVLTVCI